jgi:hypothetical protein
MPTPYDSADAKLLEEIISQAEKRLQAQLELGKAADQRAMTFAGMLLAGVAILSGLAFGDHPLTTQRPSLIVLAVGLIMSASLALWSARPIDWDIIGNEPEGFLDDIARGLTLSATRPETALNLQDMITKNDQRMRGYSACMKVSMGIAVSSAVGGIVGALFAR